MKIGGNLEEIISLAIRLIDNGANVNAKIDGVPLISGLMDVRRFFLTGESRIKIIELLLNKGAKAQDYETIDITYPMPDLASYPLNSSI